MRKKNKLKENIKYLQDLSKTVQQSINELKKIYETLNEDKEKMKLKVQNVFTKIRNKLNEREDELISEIDQNFETLYFKEEFIKKIENLPKEINLTLESNEKLDKDWNNNRIISFINGCISIENNIKDIKKINHSIEKYNLNNQINFDFISGEEQICNILNSIKKLGDVRKKYLYKFIKCPENIEEEKKYIVTGEKQNIITKIGQNSNYFGIKCEYQLNELKIYKWKIKILKSKCQAIIIWVAPYDFDINKSTYSKYGWYFNCYNGGLYSGPPFNYNNKATNIRVKDELIVEMNIPQKILKFIINKEENSASYSNIPLDKPIVPVVHLCDQNDSVEIIELK